MKKEDMTLSEFVCYLNSLTTTELILAFPNTFHYLAPSDPKIVEKILGNDAILWRLVKEFNQEKLKQSQPAELTPEQEQSLFTYFSKQHDVMLIRDDFNMIRDIILKNETK